MIKIDDDYLGYRQIYAIEFYLLKNKIVIDQNFNIGHFTDNRKGKSNRDLLDEIKLYMSERNTFLNFENCLACYKENLIEIGKIKSLKSERILLIVMNYLMIFYNKKLKENESNHQIMTMSSYSPFDLDEMIGSDSLLKYVICFIDYICIMVSKSNFEFLFLDFLNKSMSYVDKYKDVFSFINKTDDSLNWLIKRMVKEDVEVSRDIALLIRNEKWKVINSCFDYWAITSNPKHVDYFLSRTRKAWSQKKFRDGVKGKEVLNTYISKESKLKLKKIAKLHNKNINEIIEAMIDQIDLPEEPLKKLILTAKKAN
ncbi:hypothetical protein [Proteus vulgaris]|uniref:Uncharacterized protein n=1 Tax=Proteus vulgaris TaxID=585 RepID=A0A6G6SKL8_PROVU|nr:hypothetical protein [Proteus vulgaris]QIF95075.1 hypothetical protein GTH24_14730 [Proteus vulgaris]